MMAYHKQALDGPTGMTQEEKKMSKRIPAYKPSLFTSREQIIAAILDRADLSTRPAFSRTVVVRGERGSGKTFLTLHLHRKIFPEKGIKSFLIRLTPLTENEEYEPGPNEWLMPSDIGQQDRNQVIQSILLQAARWCGIPEADLQGASTGQISTWLGKRISMDGNTPYAILVDSAYEAPWPLLDLLERYLLATLASLPNVLLVITGRGEPYPWQSAYIRTERLEHPLVPFTPDETLTALERYKTEGGKPIDLANCEKIYDRARGHPLMTVLLALGATWGEVVTELISVIPEKNRETYRIYLEALAVLQGFRDGEIAPMLYAYTDNPKYRDYSDILSREEIREPLVLTKLVSWGSGWFEMDKDLRWAICQYLIHEQPEKWIRQNKAAAELFTKWIELYPRGKTFYQKQIEHYEYQETHREVEILET